jgi:hypothetical protein
MSGSEGGNRSAAENTRAIAHVQRERQMCSPGWATGAKRSTEATVAQRSTESNDPSKLGLAE